MQLRRNENKKTRLSSGGITNTETVLNKNQQTSFVIKYSTKKDGNRSCSFRSAKRTFVDVGYLLYCVLVWFRSLAFFKKKEQI